MTTKKIEDIAAVIKGPTNWMSTVMVALFVSLPPTILAWKTNEKTEQVHVLVNSNMTAMKADLAVANQRIKDLTDILGQLQKEKVAADAKAETLKEAEVPKKPEPKKDGDGK